MFVVWIGSTMVVVAVMLVVALSRSIRVGPITQIAALFGAGALLSGLDGDCPKPWVVAVIACAAIAGAAQLHRWARGKA